MSVLVRIERGLRQDTYTRLKISTRIEPSLRSDTVFTGRVRLKVEKKEKNAAVSFE
jgi:hypothetical protein